MGCTHGLERLFVGSPRRGVRIVFFIDIAFGVAGTIFALWISVRPRVDDYGGAAPSLWEQYGALEALGGSLLIGLMGFVLAFALHMGARYLKHLWTSSTLGRVCVAACFMYPVYCLLMGNVILSLFLSVLATMLAPWLLGPIVGLVGLLFGQRGIARTSRASAEAYEREKKEGRAED